MGAGWVPHVVRRGEHASGLAYAHGVSVETVWNHPQNAELRKKRTNPDVLAPTDVLWLPRKREQAWSSVPAGGTVKFVASVPRQVIKVRICGNDGKPLSGVAFEVENAVVRPPAKTDTDGTATFEVDVLTKSVVIRVPERKLAIPVLVGDLDPVSTLSGAIGRLRNLGYCGHEPLGLATADSAAYGEFLLSWFQREHELPVTGELDQATQDKLAEVGGDDGQWNGQ